MKKYAKIIFLILLAAALIGACQPAATEEPTEAPAAATDAPEPTMAPEPTEDMSGMLGTEENPIVWVLVPSQDTETVLTGADEIAAEIEEATGLVVVPLVTTDFTSAVEAMCRGDVGIGAVWEHLLQWPADHAQ